MTTANISNLKNNLEKKEPKKETGMKLLLEKMTNEIAAALPSVITTERFKRVALTAFNSNPKLMECDPKTFLAAMMTSAQLGLEPNTPLGQAYLIPYGKQVQFQIGYKGMLELLQRSNQVKTVYCHRVYENDEFEISYGLDQNLIHKPDFKSSNRGDVIGYYAVLKLINGGESFVYMTKDEVMKHAQKFSKTYNNGPWQTDFDAMAKKTALKQLLKYAPLSIEITEKIVQDNSVKSQIDKEMFSVEDEYKGEYIEVDQETGEVLE